MNINLPNVHGSRFFVRPIKSFLITKQSLGLASFQKRWWYKELCSFLKMYKIQTSAYLFNLNPSSNRNYHTWNAHNIPKCKATHIFQKPFLIFNTTLNYIQTPAIPKPYTVKKESVKLYKHFWHLTFAAFPDYHFQFLHSKRN